MFSLATQASIRRLTPAALSSDDGTVPRHMILRLRSGNRVMRRKKVLMLKIGCFIALVCCALVSLQWARIVPPLGLGWGDGNRPGGTGYSFGLLDGSLILETLYGVKPWAPGTGGNAIKFDGEPIGFAGLN